MLAPRHTGRVLLSVSERTRRTPVECRWVTRELVVTVDVDVSRRGGGRHPRGLLAALSPLPDGDGDSCIRGEVIVLKLPVMVGGDVHGLEEPSATALPGDRGPCRCAKDAEKPAIVAAMPLFIHSFIRSFIHSSVIYLFIIRLRILEITRLIVK